jgi:hypothetical protein
MTHPTKACEKCAHYNSLWTQEEIDDDEARNLEPHGECRRHAPPALSILNSEYEDWNHSAVWPLVAVYNWCGEFKRHDQ